MKALPERAGGGGEHERRRSGRLHVRGSRGARCDRLAVRAPVALTTGTASTPTLPSATGRPATVPTFARLGLLYT